MGASPQQRQQLTLAEAASLVVGRTSAVVTGAGVSVAAGLPTYRGGDGRWNDSGAIDDTSRETLYDDPSRAWRRYASWIVECGSAEPTRCHRALLALERAGLSEGVITQNVDELHERTGSTTIALHGSLLAARCTWCEWRGRSAAVVAERALLCDRCGQPRRPATVSFGEAVSEQCLETAHAWVDRADCLIVVGTSLPYPPTNALPSRARRAGKAVVLVDPVSNPVDAVATHIVRSTADEWATSLAEFLV